MKFDNYFAKKGGICKIMYKYGEGYKEGSHTACHSCLADLPRGSTELLTSTWPNAKNPAKSRVFYNFLLDENKSPWRKVLKNFSVHENHVHFHDLSKLNTQITDNLCIALRLPSERPLHFDLFVKLLGHFDIVDALYLCAQFRLDEYGRVSRSNTMGGHFAFNDHRELDYQAFINGEPKPTGKTTMNESAYVHPINVIWQTPKETAPKIYRALTDDGYSGKFVIYRSNYDSNMFEMTFDSFVTKVKKLDKATQW